ncbi:MAG TPA: hypothetical protein VJT75_10790 [Thermoleophilaceae bacterium]|nr:hypothetical protein [Thermoleophilaceae bacterium]
MAPLKCVSLTSAKVIRDPDSMPDPNNPQYSPDAHPDHYLFWGNRSYITSWQGSHWIRPWVSWYDCQESIGPKDTWQEMFTHLSGDVPSKTYLTRLDKIIRQANVDGVPVLLVSDERSPTWSKDTSGYNYLPPENKFPDDPYNTGQWALWMTYLICRYRKNVAANPSGPVPGALYGNPLGAWVQALEVMNEPNALNWPQNGSSVGCRVAQMMMSARDNALYHGWKPVANGGTGQWLAGPATADKPADEFTSDGIMTAWNYHDFTSSVLNYLNDWNPAPTFFGWSHHNYRDVRSGNRAHVDDVVNLLEQRNWKQIAERKIWLTEGGSPYKASDGGTPAETQKNNMVTAWNLLSQKAAVQMFTQHVINDRPYDDNKYGVRFDFVDTPPRHVGGVKPLWAVWRDFT